MMEERSAAYYAKRAQQERAMALGTDDPCVKSVHDEMAARYADLANAVDRPRSKLRIVQNA